MECEDRSDTRLRTGLGDRDTAFPIDSRDVLWRTQSQIIREQRQEKESYALIKFSLKGTQWPLT